MFQSHHQAVNSLAKRLDEVSSSLRQGFAQIYFRSSQHQKEISHWVEIHPFKDFLSDITKVRLPTRYSEVERLAAAERIMDRWLHKKLIAPQRWNSMNPALMNALQDRGCQTRKERSDELERIGLAGIFEAVNVQEITESPAFAGEWMLSILRRVLNDIATENLLGNNWRSAARHYAIPNDHKDQKYENDLARIELDLTVEGLIARAQLSPSEAEIVDFMLMGETTASAAKILTKNPSTCRVLYDRAKKKLKKIYTSS